MRTDGEGQRVRPLLPSRGSTITVGGAFGAKSLSGLTPKFIWKNSIQRRFPLTRARIAKDILQSHSHVSGAVIENLSETHSGDDAG